MGAPSASPPGEVTLDSLAKQLSDVQERMQVILENPFKAHTGVKFNSFLWSALVFLFAIFFFWFRMKHSVTRLTERYKQQEAMKTVTSMKPDELRKMLRGMNLPGWMTTPDIERTSWINGIIGQLWPGVCTTVKTWVDANMDQILKDSSPSWIRSIHMTRFTLGDVAPTVNGIKTYADSDGSSNSITLELDYSWAGDQDVTVTIRPLPKYLRLPIPEGVMGPLSKLDVFNLVLVKVGFGRLSVSGRVRIALTPLLPTPPFFGSVQVSLVDVPRFDFSLDAYGGDLSLLPGLEGWVHKLLVDSAFMPYTLPDKLIIPMTDETTLMQERPIGMLSVEAIEARGVPRMDLLSKSDPFLELYTRTRKKWRTQVIDNCHEPVWNERFGMLVHYPQQTLTAVLYDYDLLSSDDEIGRVILPISMLEPGKVHNIWLEVTSPDDLRDIERRSVRDGKGGGNAGTLDRDGFAHAERKGAVGRGAAASGRGGDDGWGGEGWKGGGPSGETAASGSRDVSPTPAPVGGVGTPRSFSSTPGGTSGAGPPTPSGSVGGRTPSSRGNWASRLSFRRLSSRRSTATATAEDSAEDLAEDPVGPGPGGAYTPRDAEPGREPETPGSAPGRPAVARPGSELGSSSASMPASAPSASGSALARSVSAPRPEPDYPAASSFSLRRRAHSVSRAPAVASEAADSRDDAHGGRLAGGAHGLQWLGHGFKDAATKTGAALRGKKPPCEIHLSIVYTPFDGEQVRSVQKAYNEGQSVEECLRGVDPHIHSTLTGGVLTVRVIKAKDVPPTPLYKNAGLRAVRANVTFADIRKKTAEISGRRSEYAFDQALEWVLLGDKLHPGMSISIELWDTRFKNFFLGVANVPFVDVRRNGVHGTFPLQGGASKGKASVTVDMRWDSALSVAFV